MSKKSKYRRSLLTRTKLISFAFLIVLVAILVYGAKEYVDDLRPVSSSEKSVIVTIKNGSSLGQIGNLLAKDKLIRSALALRLYVDALNYSSSLQAGTYAFSPDESTPTIVKTLVSGDIQTNLVTILPGKRIDQVTDSLINYGYSPSEVSSALNFSNYQSLPIASIVPQGTTSMEGLLWPDSFERSNTTPLKTIITESLNEMDQHLTAKVQAEFASEGLTTYQGLILTSIVNQEVNKPSDQAQVAQVFLSRLKSGSDLQSDVTAFYGAIESGQSPSVNYPSPYNTYMHSGLPPTPVSTISASALYAVTHPSNTNWSYFVTGDDGTTYYATSYSQQQANIAAYCHKLCSQ